MDISAMIDELLVLNVKNKYAYNYKLDLNEPMTTFAACLNYEQMEMLEILILYLYINDSNKFKS